jgi:hypothetical protein
MLRLAKPVHVTVPQVDWGTEWIICRWVSEWERRIWNQYRFGIFLVAED